MSMGEISAVHSLLLNALEEYKHLKAQQIDFLTRYNFDIWDLDKPPVIFKAPLSSRATIKIPTTAASKRPNSKYYTTSHLNYCPNLEKSLTFLPYDENRERIVHLDAHELDNFERTPYRPAPNLSFSGEFADFLVLLARQHPEFQAEPRITQAKRTLSHLLDKRHEVVNNLFLEIEKKVTLRVPYRASLAPRFKDKYCRTCHDYNCHLHFLPENETKESESQLSNAGILKQVYEDDRTLRWKRKFSLEETGIWMTSHVCDGPNCYLKGVESAEPTQRETMVIRKYLKKGVANFCAIALSVPNLTCAQVAFISDLFRDSLTQPQRIHRPSRRTYFTDRKSHRSLLSASTEFCECKSECLASCPCISTSMDSRARGFCEKYCSCMACSARFTGCKCQYGSCRTNKCVCYANSRECDPDQCTSCCAYYVTKDKGVSVFMEGMNSAALCKNLENTLRSDKRTAIAQSSIQEAGFGLYLLAPVEPEGYITDYTGELIDENEGERRGVVYNRRHLSYLFTLADTHKTVDATKLGNRMRYVNHKSHGEDNCTIKHVRVGGDLKILLVAGKKKLKAHQELFFNYNYVLDEVPFDWLHAYENKFLGRD